jgi:hypothetical protein
MKVSHNDLVEIGAKWLNKKAPNIYHRCQYVVTEFKCMGTDEIPDIFGIRPYGNVLIEVKTSKQDFKKDFNKRCRNGDRQIGSRRYYLVPKGLITIKDIEDTDCGWGLIEYDGKNCEIVYESKSFQEHHQTVCYLMYSVIRRQNKSQVLKFK